MADITVTIDLSDLTAAGVNFPQPTVVDGVAPTINWGTLPDASIDWTTTPPTPSVTGGSPPWIDTSHARLPQILWPTPQDVVNAILAGFGAATTWEIRIELVP